MFVALAQDEQDSVRLLAVENCVAVAALLSADENSTLVLPVVRACTQDKSWRVRYMVAEQLTQVRDSDVFGIPMPSCLWLFFSLAVVADMCGV
jgi:serine/threonine-protein phosphatase 2A regulatory subunit A